MAKRNRHRRLRRMFEYMRPTLIEFQPDQYQISDRYSWFRRIWALLWSLLLYLASQPLPGETALRGAIHRLLFSGFIIYAIMGHSAVVALYRGLRLTA